MKTCTVIMFIFLLFSSSYQKEELPNAFKLGFTQLTEEFDRDYWVGDWHAEGYRCNNNTPNIEEVNIIMEGETFIAKKTLGDDCVTTGNETFRGTLPPNNKKYNTNDRVSVTYKTGNARNPNSGQANLTLQIIDKNTFKGGMTMNITYRRAEKKKVEEKVVEKIVEKIVESQLKRLLRELLKNLLKRLLKELLKNQ